MGMERLRIAVMRSTEVAVAQVALKRARAGLAVSHNGAPIALTLTAEYARDSQTRSPWLAGGLVDVPIDQKSRRSPRMTAAQLSVSQARLELLDAIWRARMALRRAEIDIAFLSQSVIVQQNLISLRKSRLALSELRVASGEDDANLTLISAQELNTALRQGKTGQAALTTAELQLAQALTADPNHLPRPVQIGPLSTRTLPSADQIQAWSATSLLGRTDVLKAILEYDAANSNVRLEYAKRFPSLSLAPGYTWERGLTKLPFNLVLGLPPFDGNRAAITEAEARRVEAGRKIEQVQTQIAADVDAKARIAEADLTAAIHVDEIEVPMANRAFNLARRLQKAGETDRLDLTLAEVARLETESLHWDTARQAWQARLDLEDALRRPFDDEELQALEGLYKDIGGRP